MSWKFAVKVMAGPKTYIIMGFALQWAHTGLKAGGK